MFLEYLIQKVMGLFVSPILEYKNTIMKLSF